MRTAGGSLGSGGGVENAAGTLTVSGGSFTGNASGSASLEINDAEAALAGNGGGIDNAATLHVRGTMFTEDSTGTAAFAGLAGSGTGGAIDNSAAMTVEGATFTKNKTGDASRSTGAGGGGGIFNGGTAAVSTSTLNANSTGVGGESGPGGPGAGILNNGTLTVSASTLSGNSPGNGGAGAFTDPGPGTPGGAGGSGGAIANRGTLTVGDSTVYGNGVGAGGAGGNNAPAGPVGHAGGILNEAGSARLAYLTIAFNVGGIAAVGGITEVNGSIIAASTSGPNCEGSPTEGAGHNLDSGTSCGLKLAGDQSGFEPLLGPLVNNGGPTSTLALLAGSPAIDAGGTTAAGCPANDQRGVARPDEAGDAGACDIGAFESQGLG